MRQPFVNEIERELQQIRRGELESTARQRGAMDRGRRETAALTGGIMLCQ